MAGQYLYLCEARTTNGVLGPFRLSGNHIIGVRGVMGGATIKFFHKMPLPSNPENLADLTQDTEMTFSTTAPAPFPYQCSPDLPLYMEITNASGTTNLTVGMFKVGV